MALALPPPRIIGHDADIQKAVLDALTSVIAGNLRATTTYTFYEEIDAWLGPWGEEGYPLAYGRFSNIRFTSNEALANNEVTRDWLWKTTILLQEALRDFIVERVRNKTLGSITEPELRRAAFDSHARAYTEAGLAKVVLTAPILLPVIAWIPHKEFDPRGPNFGPTVSQTLETIAYVVPELPNMVGSSLVQSAFPAHGMLSEAAKRDQRRRIHEEQLSRQLGHLHIAIAQGQVDDLDTLQQIVNRLKLLIQYPTQTSIKIGDTGFVRQARGVIAAAEGRQTFIRSTYNEWLKVGPKSFRDDFQARFGGLLAPVRW